MDSDRVVPIAEPHSGFHEIITGGLLHLGALCIVLAAAYLGYDRLEGDTDKFNSDVEHLSGAALKSVKTIIPNFDEKSDQPVDLGNKAKHNGMLLPIVALCFLAGKDVIYPWWKGPICGLYCAYHAPIFRYFRRGWHRAVAIAQVVICSFIFLILVGAPTLFQSDTIGFYVRVQHLILLVVILGCFYMGIKNIFIAPVVALTIMAIGLGALYFLFNLPIFSQGLFNISIITIYRALFFLFGASFVWSLTVGARMEPNGRSCGFKIQAQ